MKKLSSLLLITILAFCTVSSVHAGEIDSASPFVYKLNANSSLIRIEYQNVGSVQQCSSISNTTEETSKDYAVQIDAAKIIDITDSSEYKAARFSWMNRYGSFAGIIDLDEIENVITSLQYIKQHEDELTNYSEVKFKTKSGFTIGAVSNSYGKKLYIGNFEGYLLIDRVDDIIAILESIRTI